MTTTVNITQNLRGIDWALLLPTFQDAVKIAQELHIQYLWIDSLCIIQDSQEDWGREAATMNNVYKHSFCTVAASSSEDSTKGCRVQCPQESAQSFDLQFDTGTFRIFDRHFLAGWSYLYIANPMFARAWCLQERQLSVRVLHYAETQLLWECRTCTATSETPWQDVNPLPSAHLRLLDVTPSGQEGSVMDKRRWFHIVEDYSQRLLTRENDKLPALSGLAQEFLGFRGSYAAGLWTNDIPESLLWRTGSVGGNFRPAKRPADYRAPTWPWVALDGRISFCSDAQNDKKDSSTPVDNHCTAVIKEVNIATSEINPTGAVTDGFLRIRGCLRVAIAENTFLDDKESPDINFGWNILRARNNKTIGVISINIW